jgi:hypothetical protein
MQPCLVQSDLYPEINLIIGLTLSEQARLVYLQEKMRQAKREERFGTLIFVTGVIFITIYTLLTQYSPSPSGIWILVIGLVFAALGFAGIGYYSYQHMLLMKQLEKMTIKILTCPKCGKQIPQGNFTFCPFCGSPLLPPP